MGLAERWDMLRVEWGFEAIDHMIDSRHSTTTTTTQLGICKASAHSPPLHSILSLFQVVIADRWHRSYMCTARFLPTSILIFIALV